MINTLVNGISTEQLHLDSVDVVVGFARHHLVRHYSSLNGRSQVHAPGSYRPDRSVKHFLICRRL